MDFLGFVRKSGLNKVYVLTFNFLKCRRACYCTYCRWFSLVSCTSRAELSLTPNFLCAVAYFLLLRWMFFLCFAHESSQGVLPPIFLQRHLVFLCFVQNSSPKCLKAQFLMCCFALIYVHISYQVSGKVFFVICRAHVEHKSLHAHRTMKTVFLRFVKRSSPKLRN